MKKTFLQLVTAFAFTLLSSALSAQMSDTVANLCARHLEKQFISDGQQYRALLVNSEETAEFHTTLFGGAYYRVAACTGMTDGNLVFSVYDTQRNLLFSNSEFKNSPYWDFKVNNTLDCIIEAKLSPSSPNSGRAVVLIGFKQ
jgi:hypothetical protein